MQIQQLAEGIFTIDNFLTQEECEELIARSESLGYTQCNPGFFKVWR